jgi:hypothetical protein
VSSTKPIDSVVVQELADPLRLVAFRPAAGGSQNNEAVEPLALESWEAPAATLFITGRQHGYIEPCGCTGLENAKGGLSRRTSFLNQLRAKGWNVVALDAGDQVRRFGRQAELKFQTTVDVLKAAKYDAVGFGHDDLRLSFDELLSIIAPTDGAESIFVSANVDVLGLVPKTRVVEAGGKKIGITSVLGPRYAAQVQNENLTITDAATELRRVLPTLQQARCDVLVLLAHTTLDETRALAKQFPMLDIIVTAGGAGEPTLEPERVAGSKTQIIQTGTKGMYVGVVGIYDDPKAPVRYERVALDARFPDSNKVLELFGAYQQQLKVLGWSGLGIKPIPYPTKEPRKFVGHEACADCHTKAYKAFVESPHYVATEKIAKPTQRASIPRHFDPECISCHVTGWNPQEYFPYVSGYLDYEESEHLHTNGCENCHGPGSLHVAAELGEIDVTDEMKKTYRDQMRLTLEQARKSACAECHDIDNSPSFHLEGAFEKYWEEVKHYGKD